MDTLPSSGLDAAAQTASDAAREITARFAAGVREEQRRLSAKGIAWAVMDEAGRMVWVHPDGSRRNGPHATADVVS